MAPQAASWDQDVAAVSSSEVGCSLRLAPLVFPVGLAEGDQGIQEANLAGGHVRPSVLPSAGVQKLRLHLTRREELASGQGDDMGERRWKVGELADATGLTVRTLHHFDEIGLLRPSERSPAGHRLYTAGDVRRLYHVLALRQLGIPLAEIGGSLAGNSGDLTSAVRSQLAQVEQHITRQQRLKRQLTALSQVLGEAREPSIDQLVATMEEVMKATYFTPGQLARLKARHNEVGGDAFGRWRQQWTEIADQVKVHVSAGADPSDPEVQATARRWTNLMEDMTGGDRVILSGMYAKMDGKGPETATLGVVSAEVWDYMKRAFAVGFNALT
jgi:DNA-binding transcriptional MerR regulator